MGVYVIRIFIASLKLLSIFDARWRSPLTNNKDAWTVPPTNQQCKMVPATTTLLLMACCYPLLNPNTFILKNENNNSKFNYKIMAKNPF